MFVSPAEGLCAVLVSLYPATVNHNRAQQMQLMQRNLPPCLTRPWKIAPIITGTGSLFNLRSLRVISKFERAIKENQHFISFLKCCRRWSERQQSSAQCEPWAECRGENRSRIVAAALGSLWAWECEGQHWDPLPHHCPGCRTAGENYF